MKTVRKLVELIVTALIAGMFVGLLLMQGCTADQTVKTTRKCRLISEQADFDDCAENPPSAKTLYAMACILASQGKDAQAEMVLRRIIFYHHRFLPARNSLAELQMRQRRVKEAMATIGDALEVAPADPVLLNNLGMCRMVLGDYEEALEQFTAAAAVQGGNARYRANMAAALGMMGREAEATSLYRQVLPEQQVNFNMGVLEQARISLHGETADVLTTVIAPQAKSP